MSYGTPSDLAKYGLSSDRLADIPSPDQQSALDGASAVADGYLSNRGTLPLQTPYPIDLIRAVCQIAAADLANSHGVTPEYAETLAGRAAAATKWLIGVGGRSINPKGLVFSTPADVPPTDSGGPRTTSNPKRGWTFP